MEYNKKIFFIAIAIIFILYSRFELPFPFYPYIDTIFSKNFTWKKYNTITQEMTQDEVEKILGKPLSKSNWGNPDPSYICWQYTQDGKLYPFADFSWHLVQVCFTNVRVNKKLVTEFGN